MRALVCHNCERVIKGKELWVGNKEGPYEIFCSEKHMQEEGFVGEMFTFRLPVIRGLVPTDKLGIFGEDHYGGDTIAYKVEYLGDTARYSLFPKKPTYTKLS